MNPKLYEHIIQSTEWGNFKAKMRTPAVRVGDIQITKHKIPFTPFFVGYAPRVNLFTQRFSYKELKDFAKDEKCICIRFDVPNVIKSVIIGDKSWEDLQKSSEYQNIIQSIEKHCKKAPKSTFAVCNVIMDISMSINDIYTNMHQKTRYNVKVAEKNGVYVHLDNSEDGFDTFFRLLAETGKRQGFLTHSKTYYKRAFETLLASKMANILIAYKDKIPLAAWMLFNHKDVLYYPYGGSSSESRQYMPSNLLAYEAIKLGKSLNCNTFDMWGATDDEKDPYWGFTRFKLGYGGSLVRYIDSYDFVVNKLVYKLFNISYGLFWKVAKIMKR